MFAALIGRAEVAELLLEKGADPSLKDNRGHTALDVAKKRNYQRVVEVLLKHGNSRHTDPTRRSAVAFCQGFWNAMRLGSVPRDSTNRSCRLTDQRPRNCVYQRMALSLGALSSSVMIAHVSGAFAGVTAMPSAPAGPGPG